MKRAKLFLALLIVFLIVAVAIYGIFSSSENGIVEKAPCFEALDIHENTTYSLCNEKGNVTLLHITQLETPVCLECEKYMREQLSELDKLAARNITNLTIVTLNLRKNSFSESGYEIARKYYALNISWHWIEDFEPFQIAGKYQKLYTYKNAFSNPAIVLIDGTLNIVGVYHIYCMGYGVVDGVRSAASLADDVEKIKLGEWGTFKGEAYQGLTFGGMFVLGVLTSVSPCSIVLLIAMLSYTGARGGRGKGTLEKETGATTRNLFTGFWVGVLFTLGMALVFFVFGCLISYIGYFIQSSPLFFLIAGVLLLIIGIRTIFPDLLRGRLKFTLFKARKGGKESWVHRVYPKIQQHSVYVAAFFLGILFAVGWAPCAISLVFPVLVFVMAQNVSVLTGGLLMFVFGLGHGVPVIPLTMFGSTASTRIGSKYMQAGKWIEKIFGLVVAIIGVLFILRLSGIYLW
jgi:cytochrome c-type biogenesis protein